MLFPNLKLLNGPVGNNYRNDPEDVKTLKRNFAAEGRYRRPVENGYIDRELNNAIYSFQRDHKLKVDGYTLPGGETEATLISTLHGFKHPSESRKNSNIISASAAPALVSPLGIMLGIPALGAWALWQNLPTEERQRLLNQMQGDKGNSEVLKDKCFNMYVKNMERCDSQYPAKGSKAWVACKDSAGLIYDLCLRGKPESSWPDLQD